MARVISRIIFLISGILLIFSRSAAASYGQFRELQGDFNVTYPSAWQPASDGQELDFF